MTGFTRRCARCGEDMRQVGSLEHRAEMSLALIIPLGSVSQGAEEFYECPACAARLTLLSKGRVAGYALASVVATASLIAVLVAWPSIPEGVPGWLWGLLALVCLAMALRWSIGLYMDTRRRMANPFSGAEGMPTLRKPASREEAVAMAAAQVHAGVPRPRVLKMLSDQGISGGEAIELLDDLEYGS